MNSKEIVHVYSDKREGRLIDEQKQEENNCLFDLICGPRDGQTRIQNIAIT
jgi:hypothetical protein